MPEFQSTSPPAISAWARARYGARLGARRHHQDAVAPYGWRDAGNRLLQQAPPPAEREQLLRHVDAAAGPEPGSRTARHDDRLTRRVWHVRARADRPARQD